MAKIDMVAVYESVIARRTEVPVRERVGVGCMLNRVPPRATTGPQETKEANSARYGMLTMLFADRA